MAYTEFFYPGCELQPGYFYHSIPELFYYTPEDGACIGAAGIDAYVTLAKNGIYAREMKKERVSSLLLVGDLFEIGCDQVFQKLLPVDAGDYLPCAIMVRDVGRVLRQYVAKNLSHGTVAFLLQSIIYLHHSLLSHRLVHLSHLIQSIP